MRPIRWGIVGAGRIAHTFASDMPATSNGRLQAVAARDGGAAAQFAAQHAIPQSHEGYQALYENPDIDAIYIATPHNFHWQHAADALRRGKAVLCEKPLTINAAECETLIGVAQKSNSYLMEAMWTWFLPAIRTAKQWLDAGRIGRIVRIHSEFGFRKAFDPQDRLYNPDLAGGCLLDLGVYPVAFTALVAGIDPDEISAVARFAPNGVEDDVVATFNYADFVATLGTSLRARLRNWAIVSGEDGYIAIPDFWRATECQLWVEEQMVDRFCDERDTNGFDYQINAVNDDLLEGRHQSETMPLAASLMIQKHMDRIRGEF